MSLTGITEVPVYRMDSVKLGDFQALNVQAAALAEKSEVLTSRRARGFLGFSFLSRFNFLLDYKNQLITFEPEFSVESSHEAVYDLDRSQALCVVLLPVGNEVVRFILDSGTDGLVLFNIRHFPYARLISDSLVRTADGERQVRRAEISGLKIGKRTLNKEKVAILTDQGPEGCDGLLPARMFSSLYFDNRAHRLVVNPTHTQK
jgi:predicted aspartyl protease